MKPEPAEATFRRVGVIGLGVMGGSLLRALGALRDPPERAGWSPSREERRAALAARALERAPETLEEVLDGADLVVVAAPLGATCALLGEMADSLAPEAVVTDVASLKDPVARADRAAGLEGRWVGSHPLCGSARSGFEASRADLYAGARVYLTSGPGAEGAHRRVAALWASLGARPVRAEAAAHDHLMAAVSHLPQLTANALADVLADRNVRGGDLGPGARDMTRLAASNPGIWGDLLEARSDDVSELLRALAERVSFLAERLEAGDVDAVRALMERTRAWSDAS